MRDTARGGFVDFVVAWGPAQLSKVSIRTRPGLATVMAVASVAVIILSLAGCSTGTGGARHPTPSLSPTSASTSQAHSPVPAAWPDSPMCVVGANPALEKRIGKVWAPPASAGIEDLTEHDAPDDAGWMFIEERGRHFAGVSLWNVKTGEQRRVHKFADPRSYQAGGGFDGRYLFWQESHSLESFDDFSLYSYDIRTGKTSHLADSIGDAKGNSYPSPLANPVISGGFGAWVQGVGPGVSALKLVDLRTGQIRTARQGRIGPVQFVGDKLIFVEPQSEGFHLVALDLHSLKAVPGPTALDGARNVAFFKVSPDGKIAYIDQTLRQLWFSNGPDRAPKLVAQLPEEFGFQGALEMSDSGIIYASQGHGSYFIDVSTGNAVKITDSQNFFVKGSHVVTNDANSDKGAAMTTLRIFDLAKGDVQACPKTPAPLRDLVPSTASTEPSVGAGT